MKEVKPPCAQVSMRKLDRMVSIGFLLILLNALQTGSLGFLVYEIGKTEERLDRSLVKVQVLEQKLDSLQGKIRRHFEND
ncbi:hypothetical protein [Helicobacter cynogastricus]|uniref:hypothetical protein n=1 Tax=Helicobacter cynogastricus TaxID=329937 RepID=UPI000CF1761D|nr:hypothetical protein [Helicobacter cynogastricus]